MKLDDHVARMAIRFWPYNGPDVSPMFTHGDQKKILMFSRVLIHQQLTLGDSGVENGWSGHLSNLIFSQ